MENLGNLESPKMDLGVVLIREVKKFPQLFDKKHPGFKFKYQKDEIWLKIGQMVNLDLSSVQNKWKNLRDQFAKERRKQAAMQLHDDEIQWIYFNHLKFLTKHVIPRKRSPKFNFLPNDEDVMIEDDDYEDDSLLSSQIPIVELNQRAIKQEKRKLEYSDDENAEIDEMKNYSQENPFLDHSIFENQITTHSTFFNPKKLRHDENLLSNHHHQQVQQQQQHHQQQQQQQQHNQMSPNEPFTSIVDYLKEQTAPSDSDTAFGKMVGERLKEMRKNKKNRLKIEITKLIYADSSDEE